MILQDLSQLSSINSKEYKGQLHEYQQKGNSSLKKRITKYEVDKYSQVQNTLYKRALYGLKMFTPEELTLMHKDKRKRITKVHIRAQKSLNIMKQEKVNQITNRIFDMFFPKTNITKALLNLENFTDTKFKNTLELKGLGITKDNMIERFIGEGILPKDFHNKSNYENSRLK